MEDKYKFYLTASIDMDEETEELKKEVASVINLPGPGEKQPDLSYFSAILVSSGENLNHAFFLGSELVAAANTIVSKALDVEHEETEIIGHLYSHAFTDDQHKALDLTELSSTETATLDTKDMHIQIGSIVYKNRFPDIAKEIANNEWKVSMECYFKDFDIKVGDMIIPKSVANTLGIELSDESIFGKSAKIMKGGKEVAEGTVARVLRGICFSGCGIVKNPANPPSVILETASDDDIKPIIFDLDLVENSSTKEEVVTPVIDKKVEGINVTSQSIEDKKENSNLNYDDTVGICINYKKRLTDKHDVVLAENYCTLFDSPCTSDTRDALDPRCLRFIAEFTASSYTKKLLAGKQFELDSKESSRCLLRLEKALVNAKKVFTDKNKEEN